ncbi:MAG: hypothetical protein ACFFHV_22735, partial [Promethearchaeota archaeon]
MTLNWKVGVIDALGWTMKLSVLLLSTILLNLSIVQLQVYSQDVEWKGKTEYEDGIRIVHNEKEGIWGKNPQVSLKLVRTLGG